MLSRIESGEFAEGTILLVEAIDHIGRLEHLETEALMNRIIAHGIEIHTLQDGLIYTRDALSDDLRESESFSGLKATSRIRRVNRSLSVFVRNGNNVQSLPLLVNSVLNVPDGLTPILSSAMNTLRL